jgi:hypothetical protein
MYFLPQGPVVADLGEKRRQEELRWAIRKAVRLIGAKKTPKHKNLAQARRILLDALKAQEVRYYLG